MYIAPMPTLIINIQVDSLALLGGLDVQDCVWIVDSSSASERRGGPELRSIALPGQRVRWTLTSVDLQAPAWLKRIVFTDHRDAEVLHREDEFTHDAGGSRFARPSRSVCWEGFVPPAAEIGVAYPYHVYLSFGNETGVPIVLTGSEIEVRGEKPADPAAVSGSSWAEVAYAQSGGVL